MLRLLKSIFSSNTPNLTGDDPSGPNGGCHGLYAHRVPPGWNDMKIAPRDGTIIEIRCNYGLSPHYGLYRFNRYHHWALHNGLAGLADDGDDCNSWREYKGNPQLYIDPTNGAQHTKEYWSRDIKQYWWLRFALLSSPLKCNLRPQHQHKEHEP